MGNNETQPQNLMILHAQNWVQAGQDEQKILFSNVNPHRKRLLSNIQTQQLIEQYELNFIAEQDYNNYVKQLNFRKLFPSNNYFSQLSNNYIYPIRYFINKSKKELCTTVYTGWLYIDKVDLRLKQINDIPYMDLVYMYKATLQGFKCLYEKVGYFDIQEQMIFITRKGEIKVWMNSNLSKNYPNFQKLQSINSKDNSQCIYGSQAQMIKDLIKLIQKNADSNEQVHVPLFSYHLLQRHLLDRLSFDLCLEQLHRYLTQYNIYPSENMRSILELFSPKQFITERTNYEQSHVNEVTSSHIQQLEKKYTPMETIQENHTLSNYSLHSPRYPNINNSKNKNYKSSQVSNYIPNNQNIRKSYDINAGMNNHTHHYQQHQQKHNIIEYPNTQQQHYYYNNNYNNNQNNNNNNNITRGASGSIVDLNKSHHSVQSQASKYQSPQQFQYHRQYNHNHINSHSHLITPVYLNHTHNDSNHMNNFHHINQFQHNPINMQRQNNQFDNIPIRTAYESMFNQGNKGFVFNNMNTMNNGNNVNNIYNINNPPHASNLNSLNNINNLYIKQGNIHKIVFNVPPISYRVHNDKQKSTFHKHKGPYLHSLTPHTLTTHPNTPQKHSQQIIQQNLQLISTHNLLPSKSPLVSRDISTQKIIQMKKLTNSNIKYHSLKQSYEIDEQIANDLQKFLGLKVK